MLRSTMAATLVAVACLAVPAQAGIVYPFVPGDTLQSWVVHQQVGVTSFHANAGVVLHLDFLPAGPGNPPSAVSATISEYSQGGVPPFTLSFETGHSAGLQSHWEIKIPKDGYFYLSLSYEKAGVYYVQTSGKIAKKHKGKKKKNLKAAVGTDTAIEEFSAMGHSKLDLKLDRKKWFNGSVTWRLTDPMGEVIAQGVGDKTPVGQPDVHLKGVELKWAGTYVLEVSGFAKKKDRVEFKRTLHPPKPASGAVPLCFLF